MPAPEPLIRASDRTSPWEVTIHDSSHGTFSTLCVHESTKLAAATFITPPAVAMQIAIYSDDATTDGCDLQKCQTKNAAQAAKPSSSL